ncbi:MarR family winged helix-turn-helix transcriptional regulator [Agromyces sp. Leaf222]|uniref:MarR family winged helix-turn-helix transcriptional regulator n=1 Tax=Agromyces sp. Leaf222 TaxID=1735688 RepID=UPI0006F89108|nr:MarR family transcriptional regulator [Agromyces sp. Leaf222]KQM80593.1 MarR family transcriptional regulator [Agromyces sp. Leaf222]
MDAPAAARVEQASGVAEADPLALDRQLCFALAVASRLVIGTYKPILEPMGLTHPQYLVMLALWEQEPLALSEIAALVRLEPATLSPLVKRLEAAGLVTRERSTRDERQLALRLTPEGRRLRDQAERVPEQVVASLGVEVDDLLRLHAELSTLIQRISPSPGSGHDAERKNPGLDAGSKGAR